MNLVSFGLRHTVGNRFARAKSKISKATNPVRENQNFYMSCTHSNPADAHLLMPAIYVYAWHLDVYNLGDVRPVRYTSSDRSSRG
jgi:hypothetical protein